MNTEALKGSLVMLCIKLIGALGGVRRPLDVPPKREIGFVSFVRAGEAKLRVCVREIRFLSLAGKF